MMGARASMCMATADFYDTHEIFSFDAVFAKNGYVAQWCFRAPHVQGNPLTDCKH
jgi:hypothetical protein